MEMKWQGAVTGATTAKDHANRVHSKWEDEAFLFFTNVARLNYSREQAFLTEDVVDLASHVPTLSPPDNRAWGAIALRAKREGFITNGGLAYSHKGKGNAAPRTVWKGTGK